MKKDFAPMLLGGDLRSIARSNEVARLVEDQQTFDDLFGLLLHHERLLVMRAADAIEKVTIRHPQFLMPHKNQLFSLLKGSMDKELKWHIAQLITRLSLTAEEQAEVWKILRYWVQNPNESKIVRVNSLQGLYEMTVQYPSMRERLLNVIDTVSHELIPSLQARSKKIRKLLDKHTSAKGN